MERSQLLDRIAELEAQVDSLIIENAKLMKENERLQDDVDQLKYDREMSWIAHG